MNEAPSITPYVRQLLPSLLATLQTLTLRVGAESSSDNVLTPSLSYVEQRNRLQQILQQCDESACLYLEYPTERLARVILEWIADANSCIDAISDLLPSSADRRLCEDIRAGILEWRVCILLPRFLADLDEGEPEALN